MKKVLVFLFVIISLCSCKLIFKPKVLGKAVSNEASLLKIEYAGSCSDFALLAPKITVNPVNYNWETLWRPTDSPAIKDTQAGCLPFYTDKNGEPQDFNNLDANYHCTDEGRESSKIVVTEVFNQVDYYYGKDYPNGDTSDSPLRFSTIEACRDECLRRDECAGFNYFTKNGQDISCNNLEPYPWLTDANAGDCYLKTNLIPPMITYKCKIFGIIKRDDYVPADGFVLGIKSDRPFKVEESSTLLRRPSCNVHEKYCSQSRKGFVTGCSGNEVKKSRGGWILNKDLVYVVPSSVANVPSECKTNSGCCSYLPLDSIDKDYLNNNKAFCNLRPNDELFRQQQFNHNHN